MIRKFFTGDTHGDVFDRLMIVKRNPLMDFDQESVMIILGDSAILWAQSCWDTVKYIQKHIDVYCPKLKILSVLGNHENFDMIEKLEVVELYGGYAYKVSDSIFYLMNGEFYTIDGETFAVYGGGKSIDQHNRIEGKSWWSQEITSFEEYENLITNMSKHNYECDFLLTHTTATSEITAFDAIPFTGKLEDYVAHDIMKIKEHLVIRKHHYFGHFHMNKTVEHLNSTCLFGGVHTHINDGSNEGSYQPNEIIFEKGYQNK